MPWKYGNITSFLKDLLHSLVFCCRHSTFVVLLDTGFMFYEEKNSQNVQSQTKKFRLKKFAIKEEALGQYFFRLQQICTSHNHKKLFFFSLLSYFLNFNPNSHKRANASPVTSQSIFKSIGRRDVPKSRDLLFTW